MTSAPQTPRTQLPPRLLPVLYFGAAHVALAIAFGAIALDPRGVAGFFYHPRMLGIVHLVTLGWITASILGSLYLVGPIALRMWIPATWLDYTACALVFIGIVSMVARFGIQDDAGMAWSAGTVGAGLMAVGVHVTLCLGAAALPRAVSAHRTGIRQCLWRSDDGRAHRIRQGLSLSAGVRARKRVRPRAPGRDRLGLDDGRRCRVSAVADRHEHQRFREAGGTRTRVADDKRPRTSPEPNARDEAVCTSTSVPTRRTPFTSGRQSGVTQVMSRTINDLVAALAVWGACTLVAQGAHWNVARAAEPLDQASVASITGDPER